MLAQLLGMGRKKDPPKDQFSSGGEKEQHKDLLANGASSLGESREKLGTERATSVPSSHRVSLRYGSIKSVEVLVRSRANDPSTAPSGLWK